MEIAILAVGRMKSGPEQKLFETYMDRSNKSAKQFGITGPILREFSESRAQTSKIRKSEEANTILGTCDGSFLIALDEHGKDISSVDFAQLLRQRADDGEQKLAFAIGGPDGHGEALLSKANMTIRLGKMTWPHQLVRIMLAEQIYRAITIMSGHPYHRV